MKNLTCLFLIFYTCLSFAQKIKTPPFQSSNMTVVINGHEHLYSNIIPQRQTIPVFIGQPEGTKLKDMVYFNPADKWPDINTGLIKSPLNSFNFSALRFYLDENTMTSETTQAKTSKKELMEFGYLREDMSNDNKVRLFHMDATPFFQPFYFRKYEVTNKEYKEFTKWILDSLAHTYLGDFVEMKGDEYIEWEVDIDWADERLNELFITTSKDQKELITSKIVYRYTDNEDNTTSIAAYPDTTVWVTDHLYAYNEPLTNNYFSHPAYDDYPVVGVSYHQAKAYCHWKSKQLNTKNETYELEVDLPKAYEWQWMAWAKENNKFEPYLQDTDWNTDLMLIYDENMATMREARNTTQFMRGNYVSDGFLYTNPADLANIKLKDEYKRYKQGNAPHNIYHHLDFNEVSGMANNVSEWMSDTYADNWQLAYERRLALWQQIGTPEALLASQIAQYYNEKCDKNGQLIYGANWLDERFSNIQGKNKAGLFAKTFLSPEKKHSTLGFRYVVRVKATNN